MKNNKDIKEKKEFKEETISNNDFVEATINEVDSSCDKLCRIYADVLGELAK